MSEINVTTIKNENTDYGPNLVGHSTVTGNLNVTGEIIGNSGVNVTGVITATSFSGDGSGLTGLAGTANIKSDTITVTGVVTATTFDGNVTGNVTGDVTGTASNASGSTGDFSIADKIIHTGDTNTAIRFPSVDTFTIETAGSERLRITSDGKFGLGTASPSGKLGVQVDTGKDVTVALTSGSPMITYRNGTGAWFHAGKHPTDDALIFSNGATTTTNEMARFDSSGRFGLGTASPSDILHLNGSTGYGLKITDDSSHIATYRTHSDGAILKTASNHALLFGTNDTERMRIGSSGQIGLGGANYGTAGQVITSNGSGSAPTWQDAGGGGTADFVASGTIANGDTVVVNSDGTVSVIAETGSASPSVSDTFVYNDNTTSTVGSVYDPDNNKVIIAYGDNGNNNRPYAVVGTVSGTSISFGPPCRIDTNQGTYEVTVLYDPSNDKVVVVYKGFNGSAFPGYAAVGTVSNNNISFGSVVLFNGNSSVDNVSAAFDSNSNKVVVAYKDQADSGYGKAIVGTVSGTSISFGSEVAFNGSSQALYPAVAFDSNSNKIVIAFRDQGDGNYGKAVVGTVSGTSISFGSAVTFESAETAYILATFDSNSNKVVISYNDWDNSQYGTAIVGTVSGTSISFGTPVIHSSYLGQTRALTFDPSTNKVIFVVTDESISVGSGKAIVGTVSGTSISYGAPFTFENADTEFSSATYDPIHEKVIISYVSSSYGKLVFFRTELKSTNLTTENYIGIAAEAISNGATGKINIVGGINEGQSGLTVGQKYYVRNDGTLSLIPIDQDVVAGTAISATKIIVKG
jgi:hypothetical protein